jgi:hypothetical protein
MRETSHAGPASKSRYRERRAAALDRAAEESAGRARRGRADVTVHEKPLFNDLCREGDSSGGRDFRYERKTLLKVTTVSPPDCQKLAHRSTPSLTSGTHMTTTTDEARAAVAKLPPAPSLDCDFIYCGTHCVHRGAVYVVRFDSAGNVVPGNRLRVRAPCPPLNKTQKPLAHCDASGLFVGRMVAAHAY